MNLWVGIGLGAAAWFGIWLYKPVREWWRERQADKWSEEAFADYKENRAIARRAEARSREERRLYAQINCEQKPSLRWDLEEKPIRDFGVLAAWRSAAVHDVTTDHGVEAGAKFAGAMADYLQWVASLPEVE